ncbi:hypothetical protein SAMN05216404_10846 [Nitrosospira multiformis]|uniref:Uncharacterized protein n=1 Tax=Nitrosospira multiformis TaxID=1231 RepID=A0A1H8K6U4_9PROT|nr:hypothetical protein [Nitrosospira multiformis]SEN88654.1 hypothetical protein SAMN05216404_10846 [Nitrosospira multiformis]
MLAREDVTQAPGYVEWRRARGNALQQQESGRKLIFNLILADCDPTAGLQFIED